MYDLHFNDPALTTFILFRQAYDSLHKVGENELSKIGLTPEKFAILCACKAYPQPVTLTEIARLLFRAKPSIAELLNRMENEGLVKRIPRSNEHAFKEIVLNPKGEELYQRGVKVMKELIDDFASYFSLEEQQWLQAAMRTVRDTGLEKLNIVAAHPSAIAQGEAFPFNW